MPYLCAVAMLLLLLNAGSARGGQSGGGGSGTTGGISEIFNYRGVRLGAGGGLPLRTHTVMTTSLPNSDHACTDFYDVVFSITDEKWQHFLNEGLHALSKELHARVTISGFSPGWEDVHTLLKIKGAARDDVAWHDQLAIYASSGFVENDKGLEPIPDPSFGVGRYVDTTYMPFVQAMFTVDQPQRVPAGDHIILSLFGGGFKKQCTFSGKGAYILFLDPPTFTHVIVLALKSKCGSQGLLEQNFREFTPAASNVIDWTKGLAKRIADRYSQDLAAVLRADKNPGAQMLFNGITRPFENLERTASGKDRCNEALKAHARP